jgi:CheY-like chemotaxis protein
MSFCAIEDGGPGEADSTLTKDLTLAKLRAKLLSPGGVDVSSFREPLRLIVLEEEFMPGPSTEILVVDDDPDLRQLLSLVLLKLGYTVRSVEDGFSALAAIRTTVPDVLLSDLYMPGMSGFELLSVVRRRYPKIAVIAMSSAYSGSEVPLGVAADAFYQKATALQDLLSCVDGMGSLGQDSGATRNGETSPVWIAPRLDGGDAMQVALTCPECMRTFFVTLSESVYVIREAGCLHCSTRIQYALVRPPGHAMGEGVRPAVVVRVLAPSTA